MWKNIFDQICHQTLKEEIDKGLVLKATLPQRKRQLSNQWLDPMSYKQFSNLLLKRNTTYEILKKRNGAADILKKTLIIIDEAHKLYGGDLKAIERPDMKIMEDLIDKSYKISGDDSCKLMLMTATPFTNSPLEFFSLTNLFQTDNKITTDKEEFKARYMTAEGILSNAGVKAIADALAGSMSYLNREKDPTQFAQPIMINVPVLMSHVPTGEQGEQDTELRDRVFMKPLNREEKAKKAEDKAEDKAKDKEKIKATKAKIKTLKREYKELMKKKTKKKTKTKTKTKKNKNENEDNEDNEDNEENEEKKKDLEEKIKDLERELEEQMKKPEKIDKARVRAIKASLIQEYMLYKKCGHLQYNKK